MEPRLDVSVVIPTFNRSAGLASLLARLLDQDAAGVAYEVLVVDNYSTDDTPEVVRCAIEEDSSGRLRYAVEPRRGVSHARNTGIKLTTAPIILFLDDDGVPGRDWLRRMKAAFDDHPEAACIGGQVMAKWDTPPPSWMDQCHTGPIAIQEFSQPFYVNARNAVPCLITANLGVRREVFDQIGGFSPDFPRNQDREHQLRMWRAGMQGLYLPGPTVEVTVPRERLTRHYHRRWRATTGKYQAMMRFRDSLDPMGALWPEGHQARTLLGAPRFIYRDLARHVIGWLQALVRWRSDERFFHETRIWYCAGYLLSRWAEHRNARVSLAGRRPASAGL